MVLVCDVSFHLLVFGGTFYKDFCMQLVVNRKEELILSV